MFHFVMYNNQSINQLYSAPSCTGWWMLSEFEKKVLDLSWVFALCMLHIHAYPLIDWYFHNHGILNLPRYHINHGISIIETYKSSNYQGHSCWRCQWPCWLIWLNHEFIICWYLLPCLYQDVSGIKGHVQKKVPFQITALCSKSMDFEQRIEIWKR